MKLLLDTCAFLWIVDDADKVPSHILVLFRSSENDVYLSAASSWEIGLKYAKKQIVLANPPEKFVPFHRDAHGIASLPVDEESTLYGARLPMLHRDPFDRLLVGQAIVHGMTIVTPDPLITQYPARVIW